MTQSNAQICCSFEQLQSNYRIDVKSRQFTETPFRILVLEVQVRYDSFHYFGSVVQIGGKSLGHYSRFGDKLVPVFGVYLRVVSDSQGHFCVF